MNPLLLILKNPVGVSSASIAVPRLLIHICTGVYWLVGAFAFQHLYPRLLDKMPMLGALRKLNVFQEKTLFNPQLFGYGLLICGVSLATMIAIYAAADAIKKRQVDIKGAYLSGVVTSIPFFIGLLLGSFILYPIHHYLGLLPMYGIMVSCCLQGAILRENYGLHLALSCWAIPALIGLQFFLLNLVRP